MAEFTNLSSVGVPAANAVEPEPELRKPPEQAEEHPRSRRKIRPQQVAVQTVEGAAQEEMDESERHELDITV